MSDASESSLRIRNANVVDVRSGSVVADQSVIVERGRIVDIEPENGRGVLSSDDQELDLRGRYLLPGLIDAHVHIQQGSADPRFLRDNAASYATAMAVGELRRTLDRGFTTVRDTAGADYGLAKAVDDGLVVGPSIRFAGKALSMTGGHGDQRRLGEVNGCTCHTGDVICDGVTEVRRAAREQLRRGAHHIKIMTTGGVGSPTDRLESAQYSPEEIRAAVEEAEDADRYVTAHAYAPKGIARALEAGVRCIEHGNLLDEETAELFVTNDAFLVPTLAAYYWMEREGAMYGAPEASLQKNARVFEGGLRALELANRAGIKIVYGTDLLGNMRRHQLTEISIRKDLLTPLEILRSATCTAADLLQSSGQIGTIEVGADADLLAVPRNPLEDIEVLLEPDRHLHLIVKGGSIHKNLM